MRTQSSRRRFATCLIGAIGAVALLAARRNASDESEAAPTLMKTELPFGPFLAAAASERRATTSWQRSACTTNPVAGWARATPTAVDVTPSIPLAPRLASVRSPTRGRPYHSTSRTGIEDETTNVAASGSPA